MSGRLKILLVAGGTGGHIIPAVAFGGWMAAHTDAEVRYMCGRRAIELEIYRTLKIEPCVTSAEGSPLGAPRGEKLKRWLGLLESFPETREFMKNDPPGLCVLFGGYVSLAALVISALKKIPAVAHEQNALAGKATRAARLLGAGVAAGWPICHPLKPGSFSCVGVPVRPMRSMNRETAISEMNLRGFISSGPVVAVMTGSLGSGRLTGAICESSEIDDFESWNFLVIDAKTEAPVKISPNVSFIPRMWDVAPLFNAADVLVTRGGASTLAEAEASGIPTMVVPWRRAADDHQMKNALELSKRRDVEIWNEEADSSADFANALKNLIQTCPPRPRDIGKRMYNASGNICKRLWDFCCEFMEGRG